MTARTQTTLPITLEQWDAMTRDERIALLRSHRPSDEAVAWAYQQAGAIEAERLKNDPLQYPLLQELPRRSVADGQ